MQLTSNQQHVLDTLQHASGPLTAYALLDQLRDQGFSAPAQVYRALKYLAEQDLVHRLESINAYVSCAHPGSCRHDFRAFAICDSCGHVDEFADKDLSRSLGRWIKGHAFSVRKTTIELHGQCDSCGQMRASASG